MNKTTIAVAAFAALGLAGCGAASSVTAGPGTPSAPPATASHSPVAATRPPAPAKPVVVAKYTGSGEQNTPSFTVPANWHLSWWYSCSSFGQSGNFIVTEFNTDGSDDFGGVSVNELGTGEGPVATYAYGDAGSHYLQINSECDWQVAVVTG